MFSVDFVNKIRAEELGVILQRLPPPGARILEIGGGTGLQARQLSERGFDVTSIDLAGSPLAADRIFPIVDYDGEHLPLEDASIDVVFSSNVLEHVCNLPTIHAETRRVLRPGGYCVHLMPSSTWRLWTTLGHHVGVLQYLIDTRVTHRHVRPVEAGAAVTASPNGDVGHKLRVIRDMVLPTRHSELGRPTKELVKFSRSHWQKHFLEHGFELVEVAPMGLFYTGNIVLAEHLTFPARERLSHVLGSSCVLYRVRPSPRV